MAAAAKRIDGDRLAQMLGAWRQHGPAYAALAARLRLLVLDGRLALRTRLPGERELALAAGVSRTTAAAAYEVLRAEGFVRTRRGSGSVVALPTDAHGALAAGPMSAPDGELIDLALAAPAAPPELFHAAARAATAELPRHLPGSGYQPFGLPELRAAVARHYDARDLPTRPEQILITNGALHAFALVLRLLTGRGDRVLVEHPTYPGALTAITSAGGRPVPVALDGGDWDLDGIEVTLRQTAPRLGYVVADYQSPTGAVLGPDRREALVGAFRRARSLLVVDETLAGTRLEGPPLPAPVAKADPRGDTVITLGSLSKSAWGGLAIGWVRAQPEVVAGLAAVRAGFDVRTPVFEQLVSVHLLGHPADVRPRIEQRRAARDALTAALRDRLPEWRFAVPAGGLALWIDMGRPVSSALAAGARAHGMHVAAGPSFGIGGAFETHVRIPFTLPAATLVDAVDRLADLWPGLAAGAPALRTEPLVA